MPVEPLRLFNLTFARVTNHANKVTMQPKDNHDLFIALTLASMAFGCPMPISLVLTRALVCWGCAFLSFGPQRPSACAA
jgi:hypothetical protein